jgi:imidazolonepropionase
MQNILSLSVINMKMTAEEALNAATINAAHSLDYSSQAGSIEVGKDADLILTDTTSYIDLFYHFGVNHVEKVWINGDLH